MNSVSVEVTELLRQELEESRKRVEESNRVRISML